MGAVKIIDFVYKGALTGMQARSHNGLEIMNINALEWSKLPIKDLIKFIFLLLMQMTCVSVDKEITVSKYRYYKLKKLI